MFQLSSDGHSASLGRTREKTYFRPPSSARARRAATTPRQGAGIAAAAFSNSLLCIGRATPTVPLLRDHIILRKRECQKETGLGLGHRFHACWHRARGTFGRRLICADSLHQWPSCRAHGPARTESAPGRTGPPASTRRTCTRPPRPAPRDTAESAAESGRGVRRCSCEPWFDLRDPQCTRAASLRGQHTNQRLKLTGAAILVFRASTSLQAAPAA